MKLIILHQYHTKVKKKLVASFKFMIESSTYNNEDDY